MKYLFHPETWRQLVEDHEALKEESMLLSPISIDQVIDELNAMVKCDQPAMHALVETRVPCQGLLAHSSVQCVQGDDNLWYVGLLGIINGLFGTIPFGDKQGWGPIAAVFNDKGQLTHFRRTADEEVRPAKCSCGCCHSPDHGACQTFEKGANGRCVYCDHGEDCHPGDPDRFNTPWVWND